MKILVWLCALSAMAAPLARADETSKAAKMAELLQLTGERRFLHEVDGKLDQEAAVRAWGRAYSENVTESELDAILAYYRSPAGQKDVSASRAALVQVKSSAHEKRAQSAVANNTPAVAGPIIPPPPDVRTAVAPPAEVGTAAVPSPDARTAVGPPPEVGTAAAAPAGAPRALALPGGDVGSPPARQRDAGGDVGSPPALQRNAGADVGSTKAMRRAPEAPSAVERPWESPPHAPDGLVVPSPSSPERCEVSPTSPPGKHPSGRSVVCVCTDEKGALTRDPVIAESSGDPRVDSGAIKMARIDSGRYIPPTANGQPQNACFRFAIDFSHHQ